MYIGGQFPRTESGRFYKVFDKQGELLANVCIGSRKDVINAVKSARNAFLEWSKKNAYHRGQILYRIAEILESRRSEFEKELTRIGFSSSAAATDVDASIDRLIYYAGWTDKYQKVFGSVNPVSSAHFNFSILVPTGVVGIIAPENSPLLGLVSVIAPILAGGNTSVVLSSELYPLTSIAFAEVLNASDVPAGVVNIITGKKEELVEHFAGHMDVNALCYNDRLSKEMEINIDELAAENIKRIIKTPIDDWYSKNAESPYFITDTQEIKTTWHPIGF